MREIDHFEEPGIDGRINSNGSCKRGMWGMAWNYLAQDADRSLALVNAVMILGIS
jgi:hypothetical protein